MRYVYCRFTCETYLDVLSVQHTGVHAVDGRGQKAGRGQATEGYGDDITALYTQN